MRRDNAYLRLYAVTDRYWTGKRTLYEQVRLALEGGVTCVQLREKTLDREAFLEEARLMKALCGEYRVPLIINDDVEVAVACGADGIHVGQGDMPLPEVRALVGRDMIVGVSAGTLSEAMAAERDGADYLGVGAVFPTSTKADAQAVSIETLKEIVGAVSIPVCAIGGVTKTNLPALAGSGVAGVAVVSALFEREDIRGAAGELLREVYRITGGR